VPSSRKQQKTRTMAARVAFLHHKRRIRAECDQTEAIPLSIPYPAAPCAQIDLNANRSKAFSSKADTALREENASSQ
jgi:hypothetical protein